MNDFNPARNRPRERARRLFALTWLRWHCSHVRHKESCSLQRGASHTSGRLTNWGHPTHYSYVTLMMLFSIHSHIVPLLRDLLDAPTTLWRSLLQA